MNINEGDRDVNGGKGARRCGDWRAFAHARRLTATLKSWNARERGHPARALCGTAARQAGRMPAVPGIFKAEVFRRLRACNLRFNLQYSWDTEAAGRESDDL